MAYTYCVTCRIANKDVGGKSYQERRAQLISNIRTDGMGYWEETTSFFFVESNADTDTFSKKAVVGLSKLNDIVVVFDPADMSASYFGPIEHEEVLKSFLPKGEKL